MEDSDFEDDDNIVTMGRTGIQSPLINNQDNQSKLASKLGPTVRPLQGLNAIKRGSSLAMLPGDPFKTFAEARTSSNDAELITVCIGVTPIGVAVSAGGEGDVGQVVNLVGRIVWGIGGATYTALFDVMNGTTFCVPASYIRLDIAYPAPIPVVVNAVQVSGSFSYGSFTQRSNPVRLTRRIGTIDAFATTQDIIPTFATAFTITTGPGGGFPFTPLDITLAETTLSPPFVRFKYADDSNIGSQDVATFPICNSAKVIAIGGSAVPVADVIIIYSLSL